MKAIEEFIKKHKESYLQELFDFIKIDGISCSGKNMNLAAEKVCDILRNSGVDKVSVLPTKQYPVVYGERIYDSSLPTVLIYGHYDVQDVGNPENWISDPFSPTIRDGRLYGRGAADNKGQVYAQIKGHEAYASVYGALPCNVKYLIEGEEEIGSPSLRDFVDKNKDLLISDVCYYSDGGYHDSGLPSIILGVKGSFYAEISIKGCAAETHAMRAPCFPNPAWRLVELLNSIHDENNRIAVKGFYDDIKTPSNKEYKTAREIPVDVNGLIATYGTEKFLGVGDGSDYYERLIFDPAVNICGLDSGYTGIGFRNILPAKATVRLDISLVPNQKPKDIQEKLRAHLDENGFADATLTIVGGSFTPVRLDLDCPYINAAKEAIEEGFGVSPVIYPNVGGAGPNDVFITTLGVPTIGIPYANADQNNHSPNENLVLDGFWKGLVTSAALLKQTAIIHKNKQI